MVHGLHTLPFRSRKKTADAILIRQKESTGRAQGSKLNLIMEVDEGSH
jgi:ribosomal protein L14